ncbi:hypothetical protein SAMN04488574_10181 [Bacillus sp. 71mf]|nr:hypothetical protein SAMN04488574_10181 [Bacillus sp. 71mf]SFS94525.1 hypothetical protein SAMN04488145_105209 [Bacillus sp. 103mf]
MLKLGVPREELDNEIEALRYFQGEGVVTLLDLTMDFYY